MSRRTHTKREFVLPDPRYNSYLVSLLTVRILRHGKKTLAQKIIHQTFDIIQERTKQDPIKVFEKAVKNASPRVVVKATRVGGSTYQVPVELSRFRGTNLALRWLVRFSRERAGRSMALRLANEMIDSSNGIGSTIRKKEETHRMAEANKAFAHLRF